MHRSLLTLAALLLVHPTIWAQPSTHRVPMPDGVRLATDVYLPADADGKFPVVLIRTPYGRAQGKGLAGQLNPQGIAVVSQDLRGRFDSEGEDAPIFGHEGLGQHKDGHDTIRWITAQEWSDGKIATWGGSASAIVQNMAAPDAPEALVGQFVMEAFSDYYHQFTYRGGVWQTGIFESWAKSQKLSEANLKLFKSHPYYDDFWKSLSPEQAADRVNAPAVFVGGWYDFFSQGTINSFMTIQNRGGPNARGRCYLVMGPVAHGLFHDRQYPEATQAPIHPFFPENLFRAWMKGESDPALESLQPVHYYVMGALNEPDAPGNFWRSADTWPPASTTTTYYLYADGSLRTEHPTGDTSFLQYTFDPRNPVVMPDSKGVFPNLGPIDLRSVEERKDVLVFTSAALEAPLEVTGNGRARLFVSSDCVDTDFTISLTDVYPDGRSLRVLDGIRRASLRNSYEKPEFLEKGKVYEVEVDLWSTSLIFNKGHRIRLAISSSNAPRFEPNPNTSAPHAKGEFRVATNTIHLSKEHPSSILLPIYGEQVR